ncbi:MAG TPA: helix-hairpin-helix domain-containing protein [Sphingobacteriaceae bacterium]|nr:helix-hairpin-helix domain-containing protein [Sphingobacteriaceae bacterium]
MENKTISQNLNLLSQLMELHGDNPFKIKSLAAAAYKTKKLPFSLSQKSPEEIEKIEGMGKSTAAKITELIVTNKLTELDQLLEKTPPGIVEMLSIKGIGPKKVLIIWKELGIENIGELYYACNENRLVDAKGFGAKTQEEIKKAIDFKMASSGHFLYAPVEKFAEILVEKLQKILDTKKVCLTGAFRRRCETLDGLDILLAVPSDKVVPQLDSLGLNVLDQTEQGVQTEFANGIKIYFRFCETDRFYWNLFKQTGSLEHVEEVIRLIGYEAEDVKSEEDIYKIAGLQFIEPELREGITRMEDAKTSSIPQLITFHDLKGTLHNHSTWSDGVHTLEEMAVFCRDELKLEYLGISDHSKTAFYADGLKEGQIIQQHREIDKLNARLAPFHIFKGIESDILYDGALDYSDDVLATFDFVVASIHSIFKMTEEKATNRLIIAIENPYTTILGHPTGRLLLSRGGYPIDHKKVIDACAANNVVIEINSNPLRLDLDWRWHQYALKKGVMLSINPDAHRNDGFYDMHYGTLIGRKGGLSADKCLNSFTLNQVTEFFNKKRSLKPA